MTLYIYVTIVLSLCASSSIIRQKNKTNNHNTFVAIIPAKYAGSWHIFAAILCLYMLYVCECDEGTKRRDTPGGWTC